MMNMNLLIKLAIAVFVLGLSSASLTFAAEQSAVETDAERAAGETGTEIDTTDASDPPPGILPIQDYTSDITDREYLTGDWGGTRTNWADHGFQFDVDSVMWTDTAVSGGSTDDTEWGGNFTYNIEWDLMRAGILPGALVQIRAETRVGSSGILNTGQIVPMSTVALSPTNYVDFDDGYGLALTQLSYLQMLSGKFGITLGKFDLYGNGDTNEFAGGRGRTQFQNWSLNYGTSNIFVPATTLGAGVVYLHSENPYWHSQKWGMKISSVGLRTDGTRRYKRPLRA